MAITKSRRRDTPLRPPSLETALVFGQVVSVESRNPLNFLAFHLPHRDVSWY